MGNYRKKWFDYNPPVFGKYRCSHCGGWFKKEDIDIDHIVPQKYGGSDELFNLQPLCKHCNRSKQANLNKTAPDLVENVVKLGVKSVVKKLF